MVSSWGNSWGNSWASSWGFQQALNVPQFGGFFEEKRKKKFKKEKIDREELRNIIKQAIEPVKEKNVFIVKAKNEIKIVPEKQRSVNIPVPVNFDVDAVVKIIMEVMKKNEIKTINAEKNQINLDYDFILFDEIEKQNKSMAIKRRRNNEVILLM